MKRFHKLKIYAILLCLVFAGCQTNVFKSPVSNQPTALSEVPALRLNFRFEPDVPAPTVAAPPVEERNALVQADFDNNRATEMLDKTLTSPDKQRILAIYHRPTDQPAEFRLDMYAADGKLIRRITYDGMAVHFIDTIVWSPDSQTVAFVAMVRANQNAVAPPNANQANTNSSANAEPNANVEGSTNANLDTNAETNANAAAPSTAAADEPKPVLTFRTEQIYICDRDGQDLKPITQNEGLIYFHFAWSPDGAMLAAMAATYQEWNYLQAQAQLRGEQYTPPGRPRLVEKNGRERRLDDNLTAARPVWSPDSTKVAVAFDKQVRVYDAIGDQPTQAAIPLRNQLLISSKTFDENAQRQEQAADNSNAAEPSNQAATLPDESSLVSFNPIITLEWTANEMLYLQTGYIKQMVNEADSARSYLRWHRLIFSPQPATAAN